MKWINPGIRELVDVYDGVVNVTDSAAETGTAISNEGYGWGTTSFKKNISTTTEGWISFNVFDKNDNGYTPNYQGGKVGIECFNGKSLVMGMRVHNTNLLKVFGTNADNPVYEAEHSYALYDAYHNYEIHFKTGENGRIDVWKDTKLVLSYRSPSQFVGNVDSIKINLYGSSTVNCSSIIYQDTRRIGLEKFKKLTINPDTEQNMPQGSTTTYTLSGLSDATEFSDITSVCAVLQATSRDANISAGTFSLEGADVGTIDVSDSSGKAYEIAHAETNSLTGKPWTRDDIEGKTLSFKVNGAS